MGRPEHRIPFNKPGLTGNELRYVADAITRGQISGDGSFTHACHVLLERELGVSKTLLTTSCTHALELAMILLEVRPGDDIIVPSFTFVSTANAFVLRGARPIFADVRRDTLNLDETSLEQLIGPRTRAIIPVHYAGVGCEMEVILSIAQRHGLAVVEDNAHGLFARYKGRHLGTFGCLAAQSFHETKNISCGEGGALVINDARYIERAEVVRQKGTNRDRFMRGEVDKYTWVDVGSSFLPSEILAAFLLAQLERREQVATRRRAVWTYYHEQLNEWAQENGVLRPTVPDYCEHSCHMYYLILPSPNGRTELIAHLRRKGILAVFHYQPLHLSEMGARFGGAPGQCPVSEWASERLVRLPMYSDLTEADQAEVVRGIKEFRFQRRITKHSGCGQSNTGKS